MGFIATLLSYIFGVYMGWGLIGIYFSMISDEYVRGILALFRWRGKKYLNKADPLKQRDITEHSGLGTPLEV
jgi:Na+-driven multidrug efflux pump